MVYLNYFPIVVVACLSLISCVQTVEVKKPNVIIILTDDQGYNDLGCYGSPFIKTPNIDQLASKGLRFTNFYAQPICGPSRTALLTGSYPLRVAELGNTKRIHPSVHPGEILLPEVLKTAGYTTSCIGKWDLNRRNFDRKDCRPDRQGFDYWFGMPLAHSMPHTRLGAGKQFMGKSAMGLYGDAVEEIDWSVGEIMKKLKELELDKNTILVFTSDNGPWRARGTHAGSAFPFRGGKVSTWEGGVRVPCIIWGHDFLKRGIVDHVTSSMDFFPTFIKMTGAKLPEGRIVDGKDISSLIVKTKKEKALDNTYYYYFYTHLQAVRQGDWKLVLPRPQAPEWIPHVSRKSFWKREDMEPVKGTELYNLRKDPSERRNVAAENPQVVKALMVLVEKAREAIGDFNVIGKGARFYDEGVKRPGARPWKNINIDSLLHEHNIHPFYQDGVRVL